MMAAIEAEYGRDRYRGGQLVSGRLGYRKLPDANAGVREQRPATDKQCGHSDHHRGQA